MITKIFCIGFHKTGTTSIGRALKMLGYKVTGPNGAKDPAIAENVYSMVDELVSQYDAFQDNPWPIIYPYLDRKFPNSRFILTTRSSASWIRSQARHFGAKETPMRQWIYGAGSPLGNEQIYIDRFDQHNREVMEYFKNRPDDLLVLDLTKGDGWDELGAFLGVNVPNTPFPHANKAMVPADWNTLKRSFTRFTEKYI